MDQDNQRDQHAALVATVATDDQPIAAKPRRKALLIINSKSGPENGSLLQVREITRRLEALGIAADVKVKIHKKQARKDAKHAAKHGYELVIAAGGDGTVEAVAAGLVGTDCALGIIPLGTYNNVATCLGVPANLDDACALIATGPTRAIDVGEVEACGKKKPRIFLELAGVGLVAAIMPVGQDVKEGRWQAGAKALPVAFNMVPTETALYLDKRKEPAHHQTLLIEVANAPRNGPGTAAAPQARLDDGVLDVQVYEGMDQAALAARFLASMTGLTSDDARISRQQAKCVEIRTDSPLPVVADSKVIGTTPALFRVRPGALLVIPGNGVGLVHPTPQRVLDEVHREVVPRLALPEEDDDLPLVSVPMTSTQALITNVAAGAGPLAAGTMRAARFARRVAVPAGAAAAGALVVPLAKLLSRRLSK